MLCENVFQVSSHLASAELEGDFQPKLAYGFSQRPLSVLDVYEAIVTTSCQVYAGLPEHTFGWLKRRSFSGLFSAFRIIEGLKQIVYLDFLTQSE